MRNPATAVFKVHVMEDGEDVLHGVGGEAGATVKGLSGVAEILTSVAHDYARRARKLRGQEKPILDILIWIERDGESCESVELAGTPGVTCGVLSSLAEEYACGSPAWLSAEKRSGAASKLMNRERAAAQTALAAYTLEAHLEHRKRFPERNSLQALLTPSEFAQLQQRGRV